ncbi:MAG: TraR/DksA C4-type zinc finger protein [Deltaproteobacteria bacterium]|jgi:DnaK suppressor protein|nr:TraR/DksA C4-type zinc finger protein [Deltaproteobacteria bacterium]
MAKTPRNDETEPLSAKQLNELKGILVLRKRKIVEAEEQSYEQDREDGALRHADEVDLASAEWDVTVEHRMRGRDVALLKKVSKALTLIEEGGYGECENCGNYIGYKRLLARPEASLCIECKEEQERVEKSFMKEQPIDNPFSFE